jgi:protein gp37
MKGKRNEMKHTIWNPWKGCIKTSVGCKNCYIHLGQEKRQETDFPITLTKDFDKPIKKDKKGNYLIKPDTLVYTCFSSDFLLESMDQYRPSLWKMIDSRKDLKFLFLTKRIENLKKHLPDNWEDGYDNVYIGVSIENQEMAEKRLPLLRSSKIKHRLIICQPLIEEIDIEKYLDELIEEVVVGGEAAKYNVARILNYEWVIKIREACIKKNVDFTFRQVGSVFIKDGIEYRIPWKLLSKQAKESNIDYRP